MAELANLLGFMSAWDRREALMKYEKLFDEAADEAEFIAQLGSPTRLAIGLAQSYVPSPPPAVMPEVEETPAEELAAAEAEEAAADEAGEGEVAENAGENSELVPAEEVAAPAKSRRLRPFGLIVSILFGLVIGLPIAIVLICVGIPFIVLGIGAAALDVWAVISVVAMLTMFSDVLVVVGAGLLICAVALLVLWFGLWLSFELGYLWIGGVVLRLCRALSWKKEVAAQ